MAMIKKCSQIQTLTLTNITIVSVNYNQNKQRKSIKNHWKVGKRQFFEN